MIIRCRTSARNCRSLLSRNVQRHRRESSFQFERLQTGGQQVGGHGRPCETDRSGTSTNANSSTNRHTDFMLMMMLMMMFLLVIYCCEWLVIFSLLTAELVRIILQKFPISSDCRVNDALKGPWIIHSSTRISKESVIRILNTFLCFHRCKAFSDRRW